jgi:hypothetical protein
MIVPVFPGGDMKISLAQSAVKQFTLRLNESNAAIS